MSSPPLAMEREAEEVESEKGAFMGWPFNLRSGILFPFFCCRKYKIYMFFCPLGLRARLANVSKTPVKTFLGTPLRTGGQKSTIFDSFRYPRFLPLCSFPSIASTSCHTVRTRHNAFRQMLCVSVSSKKIKSPFGDGPPGRRYAWSMHT